MTIGFRTGGICLLLTQLSRGNMIPRFQRQELTRGPKAWFSDVKQYKQLNSIVCVYTGCTLPLVWILLIVIKHG